MRIILLTILTALFVAGNAFAITGLGFGVRAGYVSGLDTGTDMLPGTTEELDDKMTMIGGHVKIGTLPMIDFDVAAEYAWKKMGLGGGYDLKISDFSLSVTAIYNINLVPMPMVTPYIGVGGGTHKMIYSLDVDGTPVPFPTDDATKFGYHALVGVKVKPPVFPLEIFAQYRYSRISTEGEATKYNTILVGTTLNLP